MSQNEGGSVIKTGLGVGFGIVLAIFIVCGGMFTSCVGLVAVGRVEQARQQIETANQIEIENVRLSIETYGRASSVRKVAYAVDFRNVSDRPAEINGWLKVLDANGLEIGRDRVTATIAPKTVWTTEGYVMDTGNGTPDSVKYTVGW